MRLPPTLALLTAAALAACASPDPKLYTLAGTSPAVAPSTPVSMVLAPPVVVELRRVSIPGYLDRPEIVRSAADYRVHLAKNERWSEPLGDLLQRVLADDLTRRLPGGAVYSDSGAVAAQPTRIVAVDIERLDADGTGTVVLDAQFSVRGTADDAVPQTRSVHLTAPIGPGGTTDYAAALSTTTGELADAIAVVCGQ